MQDRIIRFNVKALTLTLLGGLFDFGRKLMHYFFTFTKLTYTILLPLKVICLFYSESSKDHNSFGGLTKVLV